MIPEVETARLKLRGHCAADLDDCFAMWADPGVVRFIGGRAFTREETWARVLRYVGHWEVLGYGYWVIEDRASGAFLGELGFADMKRAIDPPLDGMPEIGWALAPAAHGKGYATEAVKAAVEWGDRTFGADVKTCCIIGPQNVASIRVAEKCGYRQLAQTTYKDTPTLIFRR